MSADPPPPSALEERVSAVRTVLGGVFMGLANLVPGVSGGTMILALGLYDRFIGAVSDLTRLRLRPASLGFLGWLAVGLLVALLGFSTLAVDLVTHHRWVMYSLFVGMTLGGVPDLWRALRPLTVGRAVAAVATLAGMACLAWRLAGTQVPTTAPVLAAIGALAASSMILPGISGSYLLLVFGVYDIVWGAVSPRYFLEDPGEALAVIVPIGIGAVLGIALLSNLLRHLLVRHGPLTHAALLGFLLGSVLGLYPFREPVHPELADRDLRKAVGMLLVGASVEEVAAESGIERAARADQLRAQFEGCTPADLKARADEQRRFDPTGTQIAAALGLLVGGFGLTRLLGRHEKG